MANGFLFVTVGSNSSLNMTHKVIMWVQYTTLPYGHFIFLDSSLAYNLFGMIVPAGGGILHFIIQLLFSVVISLVLMMISTCWMQEFRSLLGMCVGYVKKFLRKT